MTNTPAPSPVWLLDTALETFVYLDKSNFDKAIDRGDGDSLGEYVHRAELDAANATILMLNSEIEWRVKMQQGITDERDTARAKHDALAARCEADRIEVINFRERMREESDCLKRDIDRHLAITSKQASEIAELREALKPFADDAEGWTPEYEHLFLKDDRPTELTVRHLLRASAALSQTKTEPTDE